MIAAVCVHRSALFWLLLACVFCQSPSAIAQPSPAQTNTDWHFRYELFQMLLEQQGLTVANARTVLDHPSKSVIVKVGNQSGFLTPRSFEIFCAGGGRAVIAADISYSAGRLCEFRAAPVEAPEVVDRYQGHRDCLRLTRLNSSHPLMKGVGSVVVNRAGWLSRPRRFAVNWNVAASLPQNCSPVSASEQPVLATVDNWGRRGGQLVLASDPSLLTNGMLWHGDNALLAINLSRLLTEGDRKHLLFIADDQPLPSYADSPLMNTPPNPQVPENLPEPGLQTMLRVANSVIKNVEESNVVNEAFANRPRTVAPPYYRRSILFGLAALAAAIAIWKLSANGPVPHTTMPSREMKSAYFLSAEQKTQASELGLSASMLARDFCKELTASSDPAVWLRRLSTNAASGDTLLQKTALEKRLAPVVDLAVNSRTVHISRRRFESLGKTIQDLRQLHKEGRLLKSTSEQSVTSED